MVKASHRHPHLSVVPWLSCTVQVGTITVNHRTTTHWLLENCATTLSHRSLPFPSLHFPSLCFPTLSFPAYPEFESLGPAAAATAATAAAASPTCPRLSREPPVQVLDRQQKTTKRAPNTPFRQSRNSPSQIRLFSRMISYQLPPALRERPTKHLRHTFLSVLDIT
jgi:hypothetical protein